MVMLDVHAGRAGDAAAHLREGLEVTVRAGGRSELLTCLDGCGALKRLGTAAVRNRLKSVKSQYVTARLAGSGPPVKVAEVHQDGEDAPADLAFFGEA